MKKLIVTLGLCSYFWLLWTAMQYQFLKADHARLQHRIQLWNELSDKLAAEGNMQMRLDRLIDKYTTLKTDYEELVKAAEQSPQDEK